MKQTQNIKIKGNTYNKQVTQTYITHTYTRTQKTLNTTNTKNTDKQTRKQQRTQTQ